MTKRVESVTEEMKKEEHQEPNNMMRPYPLQTSIKAYGQEIRVINLRKPSGADLLYVGNPVIFSPQCDPPRVEHDLSRVVAMVARLSEPSIPSSSIADLSTEDIVGLAWHISPFFIPAR